MDQGCRLYLRFGIGALPGASELARIAHEVAPAALLVTGLAGGAGSEALRDFMVEARRQNLAVLIENDVQLAKELDADGVHLRADSTTLADARRLLGEAKSIGVSCVLSRHEAMSMAEEGADYVAFGEYGVGDDAADRDATEDMLAWWSELFEIPCVAWAREGYGVDELHGLVRAGADFLAAGDGGRTGDARAEWFLTLAGLAGEGRRSARPE
ncbi:MULTISPECIES: thiamine phosphate synthase [Rhodomicrobium]|uniref:thiamine phosphate synthase n=1 Tax=Rhodomicrobium TaxID=1068 RepID=UPI000F73D14A|nr:MULTISPECIES: thiamine phosphate synthase [Rhodomicrobium]